MRAAMKAHEHDLPLQPRILMVMPAFNEGATIQEVIVSARAAVDADVLVVSDASDDDTAERARAAGALVMELPLRSGAWMATQAGLRHALRRGYDFVFCLDADGQHDPRHFACMLARLHDSNADLVIGTFPERLSPARRLAARWFRLLTGLGLEDLTSGMRIYGPRAVRAAAEARASLLDYQDLGVLLHLQRADLRLREAPAPMRERLRGKSHVFSSWWKVLGYMLQTTVLCLASPRPLWRGQDVAP